MNKIETLLKELCPNGITYGELNDVCEIIRGVRVTKKDLLPSGYPVVSGGTGYMGFIDKYNREPGTITIAQYGSAGYVNYQKERFWANDVCFSVYPNEKVLNKFLYHFLLNKQNYLYEISNRSAIPYSISKERILKIKIPIPPLEIQGEIVKILDKFTDYVTELTTELTLRQKQYHYYRDKLLSFEGENVEIMSLGALFDFKNGLNKGKEFFGKGTSIVNYTDVYKNIKLNSKIINGKVDVTKEEQLRYDIRKGDVFFTRTSETIEEIGRTSVLLEDIENGVFSGFILRARPKTELLLPEYCAYCFNTSDFRKNIIRYSTYTTRALTNGNILSKLTIPVPSIIIQRQIVEILDRLYSISNDINNGIPKEIELRQKQYEFYRNKLLSFD